MDTKEKQGAPKKRTRSKTANAGTVRRAAATTNTAQRKAKQQYTAQPQKRQAVKKKTETEPTPDVVYTPAKPFSRSGFVLRLATVAAIVVALIFGVSLFFKVSVVTVSGADKYTPYMIQEASGIQNGDNLLTLDKVRASGKIIAELPYVESVRIGIQLPDTVNIEITEMDVVYSIKDSAGAWWLINADGRVVINADSATAGSNAQIMGVALQNPASGQQAAAADVEVNLGDNSQTSQNLSGTPRLSAALSILQYLEDNSIIGTVASVNVTDLNDIRIWYGQQYEVLLGDTTQLGYKIQCMKSAIAKLEDYQQGVLDVSFTTYPNDIKFSKFPNG